MRIFTLVLCALEIANTVWGWQKCCPDIGCISNPAPYDSWPEPECPDYVTFTLYTRLGSAEPVTLQSFPYSYDGRRRTIFITHGLIEGSDWDYIPAMKDALLQKEDANVIVIDWKKGAGTVFVPQAASNSRAAGIKGSKVAQHLMRLPNADPSRFWCVGFSTGAHLCGYLGMDMPANLKIGRVTGLSPAGPSLEDNPDVRIGVNPSAARFVDIIHSDVSHLLGTHRRLGHHDYYYRGHEFSINLSLKSIFNLQPICEAFCQHRRSIDFFTQSLKQSRECFASTTHCTSENALSNSCVNDMSCWAYGGYYASQSCTRTGIILMKIDPKEPYCTV